MKNNAAAIGALALLGMSGLGAVRGQEAVPTIRLVSPTEGITVSGHSELKEKPDVARVTLTVTTMDRNSAPAVRQNAEQTTAVLAGLQGIGIAPKDLQTQSYTVQPQFDYSQSPPKRKGYQVQNSLQVTVHDLTKVGLVIDTVTAGGSAEIGDVSFDLSDKAQAQADALASAVTAAKQKAAAMASAAGVAQGRLLTMTEGAATEPSRPAPVFARAYAAAAPAPQTPIADQQITVAADVTLVYALGAAK